MYALQCKHIGIQSTAAHSLPVVDCKAVVETSIRKDWGFCVSRGYNWGTLINQFQRRLRELTNSGTTHRECKSWEFAPQTSHHVGVGGATHNLSRISNTMRDKPYYQYSKDRKILNSSPSRHLEEKIKAGAMGVVGAKKMAEFRNRDWAENGDARREAIAEQVRLKAARQFRKNRAKFLTNVPYELRKEYGEKMNHLRAISGEN